MVQLCCALVICFLATSSYAEGPCPVSSPDPAESPDGFGQAVGERGETNSGGTDGGDAYTGDPTYGDCDGR